MTLRRGFVLAILIVAPEIAFSQEKVTSCREKEGMALQLIPRYYQSGELDKIDSVLTDLDNRCSIYYKAFSSRMRQLLKLKDHSLDPKSFNKQDFLRLGNYISNQRMIMLLDSVDENPEALYKLYFQDRKDLVFSYNDFTKDLAIEILPEYSTTPDCSTEKIILNAYSGDLESVSRQLLDKNCTAPPATIYRNELKLVSKRVAFDAYAYTGVWLPRGNNRVLGNHPLVGFGIGGGRKFIFDLNLEFRFKDAANDYVVQYKGQSVSTRDFFGAYAGIDVNYIAASTKRSKIFIVSGAGYDGFVAVGDPNAPPTPPPGYTVTSQKYPKRDDRSINSFNVNLGLGYRFFTRDGNYLGLEARNNFVNYRNHDGTPLDGNTISLRLMYGVMRDVKETELQRLHNIAR